MDGRSQIHGWGPGPGDLSARGWDPVSGPDAQAPMAPRAQCVWKPERPCMSFHIHKSILKAANQAHFCNP